MPETATALIGVDVHLGFDSEPGELQELSESEARDVLYATGAEAARAAQSPPSPGLEPMTAAELVVQQALALSNANAQFQKAQAAMVDARIAVAVERAQAPYGDAFGLPLDQVLSVLIASSLAHAERRQSDTLKEKGETVKQTQIDELTAEMKKLTADAESAAAQAGADAGRIEELETELKEVERVNGLAQVANDAARAAQDAREDMLKKRKLG
jgi:hypothetical protein